MVDAGAFQRVAERELGEEVALKIRAARGELTRVALPPAPPKPKPIEQRPYNANNIEEVVRAALDAHDGVLSLPLFYRWCEREGLPAWAVGTICRRMGVGTWTEALHACGGRRGVTLPDRRLLALHTIRQALDAHGGRATLEQYRSWARASEAEWRCPQGLAVAAGYARWLEACAAARALPSQSRDVA
jgi:hypothetical protein